MHILILCPREDETTRAVAGLILKNSILRPAYLYESTSAQGGEAFDPTAYSYVKAVILQGMADEKQTVRQTVGTVIVNLMMKEEDGAWPEGLEALMKAIDSSNPNEQEGAFNSLVKLAEDCPGKLDCEIHGQRPLNYLIERFLAHTEHPKDRIRSYALTCLKHYLSIKSPALMVNIDALMAALFARASDSSPDVRSVVCQSLSILLSVRPDRLMPEISNVAEYMLYSAQDADETVALEAAEFWLTFGEDPALSDGLKPWLPKVAPMLLNGMVYSENDLDWLGADDAVDENVPDRAEDIKPRFHGRKEHAQSHGPTDSNDNGTPGGSNGNGGSSKPHAEGDDDDEFYDSDADDDDDDEDDDFSGEWNIRKCSAAALDVMAVTFGDEMLQILLPLLRDKLFSEDWLQRESGILALGAIAEGKQERAKKAHTVLQLTDRPNTVYLVPFIYFFTGCMEGITSHLPTLIPFLVQALSDPKPLVRSITCWTIGRYSAWAVEQEGEGRDLYFVPVMEGLLRMTLDPNKRVQEAGCSAFATLEEEAGPNLEPYLEPILRNLVAAFGKYQQKNLLILYDAIGTLADSVGPALSRPEYLQILMPPLIDKWMRLTDDDMALIPLLECLSSVTIAAGTSFAPYAVPVFERCLTIVKASLDSYQIYLQHADEWDEPEPSFVVVALDLLSGLCQGLGGNIIDLVHASGVSIVELMTMSIQHPVPAIRQSALALLGDVAIAAFGLIQPHLAAIMPLVINEIQDQPSMDCISVCNNATWAVGEIALQHHSEPTNLEPYIAPLIERLIPILCGPNTPRSLTENAAVTIGRIGLICPVAVAPSLPFFATQWCSALSDIKDNDEKDSAFRGFCMLIQANPGGIQKDFMQFCNAVCRWQTPSPELNDMFRKIMVGFKQMLGDQAWAQETSAWPEVLLRRLNERYGV